MHGCTSDVPYSESIGKAGAMGKASAAGSVDHASSISLVAAFGPGHPNSKVVAVHRAE